MLISLTTVIISLRTCVSNHHAVHLKHMQFLFKKQNFKFSPTQIILNFITCFSMKNRVLAIISLYCIYEIRDFLIFNPLLLKTIS